jgi:hypothetical protein
MVIIESLMLLCVIMLIGFFFNLRIKRMTPRHPLHRHNRRPIRKQPRELGTNHSAPPPLTVNPPQSHTHRKDYVEKISKTDPRAVAAMITYWTKGEDKK